MPTETGTNHSPGDSNRSHRAAPPVRGILLPLAALALAALAAAGWVQWRTWDRLNALDRGFLGAEPERFVLGLQLRDGMRQLDISLLRFQLSGESPERDRFHETARDLSGRIGVAERRTTGDELRTVTAVREGLAGYLAGAAPLLERSLRGVRREAIAELQEQIDRLSAPLMVLADELIAAQARDWDALAARSHGVVAALRWLTLASIGLALSCLLLMAAALHQFKVAPLRARLLKSRAAEERQEKLASLGVLAAGVAHELRNPLTAIKFRLFSLRQVLPGTLADNEDLAVVEGEVRRLERIAGEFLQFARPGEPHWGEVTSSALLEEAAGLVRGELDRRGLVFQVEPGDPVAFRADRQQLQQVLINLVHNAADSTRRGGTITLRARSGAARLSGRSRSAVWLEVADTGSGIPPEAERRLFDPFFSTKPGGTGLGLPIAARIVEGHGGSIQYVTEPGKGTTFSVVLPRVDKHESEDSADRG